MRWTRKGFEEDAAEAKVENWSGNGARPAEWFRAPTQWFYGPTQWLRGPTQWFYAPTRRVVTYAFFVTIGATTPARSEETCADSTCAIAEAPTAVASVASIASSAIAPARRIVVDLPARTLTLYENGRATHVYPAAVGRESTPTPSGSFTIINRLSDPVYYGAETTPVRSASDHAKLPPWRLAGLGEIA